MAIRRCKVLHQDIGRSEEYVSIFQLACSCPMISVCLQKIFLIPTEVKRGENQGRISLMRLHGTNGTCAESWSPRNPPIRLKIVFVNHLRWTLDLELPLQMIKVGRCVSGITRHMQGDRRRQSHLRKSLGSLPEALLCVCLPYSGSEYLLLLPQG